MLRWMWKNKIHNEHIRWTTSVVQAAKKITDKRLKWYGHVRRMKEGHIVRRMLDVDIPGKRRRGWPNLRWKDACQKDMTAIPATPDWVFVKSLDPGNLPGYDAPCTRLSSGWKIVFSVTCFRLDSH